MSRTVVGTPVARILVARSGVMKLVFACVSSIAYVSTSIPFACLTLTGTIAVICFVLLMALASTVASFPSCLFLPCNAVG